MLFKDARDYQILFLSGFLFLGILTRDWTLRLDLIGMLLLSCLLTQAFLSLLVNATQEKNGQYTRQYHYDNQFYHLKNFLSIFSLRSATITALGLCLLLRGNHWTTIAIAGCLAIASKFIFRFREKHFFNPANFGIIATLILTDDAWVSPGQWGTDWWYLLLFAGTGGIILKRVGRWDTSAAFLLTYIGLEAIRNFWLGWSLDVLQHQLTSGSLLLFAFFMITDPRSIPNATISRIIWAVSIAILTFILQHAFYLSTAVFWALFSLSPLTIILDSIWSASRFSWQSTSVGRLNLDRVF
ncbi:Na+-transporting NADH:ubiquinone oxidoreductase, subunit NqrB [Hydrococcus rivularis NIES-593]|uniref:Na+-transporting NADH:ubiquinone oxidoreductase, subunit NqrB n=1 Tax=Hydrococcus rivularis NIES-593 TaxID=1921803 RepID=A0A1U7HDH2_9CYAN|nr:RnfABCDGE type electron transport complex subunit D [Hydrococcus rivularis]OKH21588.1 Na+-transporting NADH:ubiquinone oxidoreductase, subunit NqrB [Hydrococcus rivularis NIES-593]